MIAFRAQRNHSHPTDLLHPHVIAEYQSLSVQPHTPDESPIRDQRQTQVLTLSYTGTLTQIPIDPVVREILGKFMGTISPRISQSFSW